MAAAQIAHFLPGFGNPLDLTMDLIAPLIERATKLIEYRSHAAH